MKTIFELGQDHIVRSREDPPNVLILTKMPLFVLAMRFREATDRDEIGPSMWKLAISTLKDKEGEAKDEAVLALAKEIKIKMQALRDILPINKVLDSMPDNEDIEGLLGDAAGINNPDCEMLELDRLGAAYLASMGEEGRRLADKIRTKSRERLTKWLEYQEKYTAGEWENLLPAEVVTQLKSQINEPLTVLPGDWISTWQIAPDNCPDPLYIWRDETFIFSKGGNPFTPGLYFKHLAAAIWLDRVKPIYERQQRFVPAISRGVFDGLLTGCAPSAKPYKAREQTIIQARNRAPILEVRPDAWMAERFSLALADSEAIRLVLEKKLKALSTPTGLRTLIHLVKIGNMHCGIDGLPAPAIWEVPGGLAVAARELGLNSKRDPNILRDTLDALAALQIPLQGDNDRGQWGLLDWNYAPAKGRSPGLVKVYIYEPLTGTGVHKLGPQNRLLTPIPDLPPPDSKAYVGDRRTRAAQGLFHFHLALYLADRSRELANIGGIEIQDKDWQNLAEQAELPSRILPDLKRAYGAGLWPVLNRLESGLYIPSDPKVLDFLTKQGKLRNNRSAAGKESSRKRNSSPKLPPR